MMVRLEARVTRSWWLLCVVGAVAPLGGFTCDGDVCYDACEEQRDECVEQATAPEQTERCHRELERCYSVCEARTRIETAE
jgi:hypothetical protein